RRFLGGGKAVSRGRDVAAAGIGRHARTFAKERTARVLRRQNGAADCRGYAAQRRLDYASGCARLHAERAPAAPRKLSRIWDHFDAASFLRRRGLDRDTEHSRRLRSAEAPPLFIRVLPPPRRGDAT